jgi:hypothetical protein
MEMHRLAQTLEHGNTRISSDSRTWKYSDQLRLRIRNYTDRLRLQNMEVYPTGRVGVSQPVKKNGRCVERREE